MIYSVTVDVLDSLQGNTDNVVGLNELIGTVNIARDTDAPEIATFWGFD